MATLELEPASDHRQDTASWAAVAFIASYSSPSTRQTYTTQLQLWLRWCTRHDLDPLVDVRRPTSSCTHGSSKHAYSHQPRSH